jgi:hypothetical protein
MRAGGTCPPTTEQALATIKDPKKLQDSALRDSPIKTVKYAFCYVQFARERPNAELYSQPVAAPPLIAMRPTGIAGDRQSGAATPGY